MSRDTHALYVAAISLKDVYYLVTATLRRVQRVDKGVLSEADSRACNEIAWSCVRQAMDYSIVANTGKNECLDAFVCHSIHGDFEDNLVLASARAVGADVLVTGDEQLALHSPIGAMSPQALANLLMAESHGV